jgi:hypothetical protein
MRPQGRRTMEPPVCKNIRSRRHPDQRCSKPASHGEYCGIHYKFPRPFASKRKLSLLETGQSDNIIIEVCDPKPYARLIQKWWRLRGKLRAYRRQGPARWNTAVATNTTDFYSMENISSISGESLFSYYNKKDKMIYAFDIKSLTSLLEKTNVDDKSPPQNPYNRQEIEEDVIKKINAYVRWCRQNGVDTRWTPIEPQTPDQLFQMKVTDLFQKIDELNYYTNPEWFIKMSIDNHRCFYVELHDIWNHRAELAPSVRLEIIPAPARPFKTPVREVVALKSIDLLRKINMDIIRMFISAAVARPDRILGAMYVVTAMTLVSKQCAEMYPWLFESAHPGIYHRYQLFNEPPAMGQLNAYTYLNAILQNAGGMPQLLLPPPGQILHQMGFIQQMMMGDHANDFDDYDDGQIGGGHAALLMPPAVSIPALPTSDAEEVGEEGEEMEGAAEEIEEEMEGAALESTHAPLLLMNEAIDSDFHTDSHINTIEPVASNTLSVQTGSVRYSPIVGPVNNILNPEDEFDITPSNNILNPEDDIMPFAVRSSIQNVLADYSEDAENIDSENIMDHVD